MIRSRAFEHLYLHETDRANRTPIADRHASLPLRAACTAAAVLQGYLSMEFGFTACEPFGISRQILAPDLARVLFQPGRVSAPIRIAKPDLGPRPYQGLKPGRISNQIGLPSLAGGSDQLRS